MCYGFINAGAVKFVKDWQIPTGSTFERLHVSGLADNTLCIIYEPIIFIMKDLGY